MAYTMDSKLEAGIELINEGKYVKGLRLVNESARLGTTKGKSFFEVGKLIRNGCPGIAPDPEHAREYYDTACFFLFASDCDTLDYHYLGDYYYYALGTEPQDVDRALEYYRLACKDNDDPVALKMVEQIEGSKVKEADEVKPVETGNEPVKTPAIESYDEDYEAVVKEESADDMLLQAIRMIDNVASTEEERLDGVELAKAACEKGSARAAILVGFLYEGNNSILTRDLEMAKKYYLVGISRGSASAEYRLGLLYLDRDCPFRDDERGHDYIVSSARKGYSYALNYLGDCFRSRVNDPKNLAVAYRYYSLAGERKLGIAYHNMAEIDASRQNMALSKEHENYATRYGYDPVKGLQDPLFFLMH